VCRNGESGLVAGAVAYAPELPFGDQILNQAPGRTDSDVIVTVNRTFKHPSPVILHAEHKPAFAVAIAITSRSA